jgi:hypothetical protein
MELAIPPDSTMVMKVIEKPARNPDVAAKSEIVFRQL